MSIINVFMSELSNARARIERAIGVAAQIQGFNPSYISLTPGTKPEDYTDGVPYGWYLKESDGHLYIQPVIWDDDLERWDDFGPAQVTRAVLDSRLQALSNEISDENYISSNTEGIAGASSIANMVPIDKDDFTSIQTHTPGTVYLILEDE